MRESHFIDQNKEKWHEFEKILQDNQNDPEKISNLFVQVTEDLSYARTFYPHRTVRYYLNHLSRKVFGKIYRNKVFSIKGFWQFWTDELPYLLYDSRKQLRLSLFIFILAMALGVLSSARDSSFMSLILGEEYISMTVENIGKGDPMAVYKKSPGSDMFLYITWNNIKVAFNVFVFGLLAGIGSVYILIYNALMLGAFQYFFHEYGVLSDALITIWQHGTLEISSIIIAGAAGLTLGRGLVFPGTYTRIEAFRLSAYRGMKILMGTIPLFIMAGFIESFITRQTDAPIALRISVIIASLAFIIFYFVWLPHRKQKKNLFRKYPPERVPPSSTFIIRPGIYSNALIIKDAFTFIKCHFSNLFRTGAVAATAILLMFLFVYPETFIPFMTFGKMQYHTLAAPFLYLADIYSMFQYNGILLMLPVITILITWMIHRTMLLFTQYLYPGRKVPGRRVFQVAAVVLFAQIPFLLPPLVNIIGSLLLAPFLFSLICQIYSNTGSRGIVSSAFNTAGAFYRRLLYIFFITGLIGTLLILVFATPLMYIYIEVVTQHIDASNIPQYLPYLVYLVFTGIIGVFILFPFVLISGALKRLSINEIQTAASLIHYFENTGEERRAYGFFRE